jgi:hypothetical protein
MSRWQNDETGVVVNVDDSKDARFASGWSPVKDEKPAEKPKK